MLPSRNENCCSVARVAPMSRASKLTLAFVSGVTAVVVFSVHYGQRAEQAVCLPTQTYLLVLLLTFSLIGHARWCGPRRGAAEGKKGETSRLRHAASSRRRVQEGPGCFGCRWPRCGQETYSVRCSGHASVDLDGLTLTGMQIHVIAGSQIILSHLVQLYSTSEHSSMYIALSHQP